jgi:hypothetical protein
MAKDNEYLDLGYGQGLEGWGITPGDIYQQRQYALDEANQGLLSFIGMLGMPPIKKELEEEEPTEIDEFKEELYEKDVPLGESLEDIDKNILLDIGDTTGAASSTYTAPYEIDVDDTYDGAIEAFMNPNFNYTKETFENALKNQRGPYSPYRK